MKEARTVRARAKAPGLQGRETVRRGGTLYGRGEGHWYEFEILAW